MSGNTLGSRTMNLNYVNFLACIQLGSDWFKNNQLCQNSHMLSIVNLSF